MPGMPTVTLGPVDLPAVLESTVAEVLGNSISEGLRPSLGDWQTSKRDLTFTVHPLHGEPDGTGERRRRQCRSLLSNAALRSEGVYFTCSPDPELDGWLLIGGGAIAPGDGGVSFSDWRMALSDTAYLGAGNSLVLGQIWRTRARNATGEPRDSRGAVFTTDFPSVVPRYIAGSSCDGNEWSRNGAAWTTPALGYGFDRINKLIEATSSDVLVTPTTTTLLGQNRPRVYDMRASTALPIATGDPEVGWGWADVFGREG